MNNKFIARIDIEFNSDRDLDESSIDDVHSQINTRLFEYFEPYRKNIRVEKPKNFIVVIEMEFELDRVFSNRFVDDVRQSIINTGLFRHFESYKQEIRVGKVQAVSLFNDEEVNNEN